MTNVIFPRKELEKHFPLNDENLEKISLLGTPLERADKNEIEIEVFPNRPDLISLQGFARAFKAFIGKETGLKKYKVSKPEKDYKVFIKKEVNDVRPHTVCAIIKNLNLDDEKIKDIINLQEKLHITIGRNRKKVAIGVYPLEKIKLPITFTAKNPLDIKFQPLEFKKELSGKQILQKHPTGKKYSELLENQKTYPVFIDANNSILSMPPIINSNEVGKVTKGTKEIFIECSGFDLNTLNKTLNIIVTVFSEMGGSIYQMQIKGKKNLVTPDLTPEKIRISLENVNKLLGLSLKESDLQKLLPRMGYNYSSGFVFIPAWRTDILHEVDIIEDIAIAYGFDNFTPEIPNISTAGSESFESKTKRKLSEILIGLQALETSTLHLIKKDESDFSKDKNQIELLNSKTEFKYLRQNLLIPTLRILSENTDAEYPQKIFEIGKVFKKPDSINIDERYKETGIIEQENLIFAISPGNYTQIKQHMDYFMKTLNINYKIEKCSKPNFIEGRTCKIIINNKDDGYMGEVHPIALKKWGLKMPLAIFEISLEEIFSLLKEKSN